MPGGAAAPAACLAAAHWQEPEAALRVVPHQAGFSYVPPALEAADEDSDGESPSRWRSRCLVFSPTKQSSASTVSSAPALWQTLSSSSELVAEDPAGEGGAASSLMFERWRRKIQGERKSLRCKVAQKFQPNHAEWDRFTWTVRLGVPPGRRREIWYACSGAATKERETESSYGALLAQGRERKEDRAAIEKDVPRAGIPEEEAGQRASLANVLLAFAAKNPRIGYCQSTSFVAAALLVYNEEERAFWMLCSLVEDLMPAGYYAPAMTGIKADLRLMDSLVEKYLPQLHGKFEALGIDWSLLWLLPWLHCLFVTALPAETSHRVLDCLLHEGPKVLFRAALALLRLKQPELLKADSMEEVFDLLRPPGSGDGTRAPGAQDADVAPTSEDLLGGAHGMYGRWLKGLSTDTLGGLREGHLTEMEAEAAAH